MALVKVQGEFVPMTQRLKVDGVFTYITPVIKIDGSFGFDAVRTRIRNEAAIFNRWLSDNNVEGVMSEVGIPWDQDVVQWSGALDTMFSEYDKEDVSTIMFTAQGAPGPSYGQVTMYTRSTGSWDTTSIDMARESAASPERNPPTTNIWRGIDVFGPCFNDGGGSGNAAVMNNSNPGTYGVDWWYEPLGTYQYLASRGYNVARIGIRWERLQSSLWGGLNLDELIRIKQAIGYAQTAGMQSIIELHNYAMYVTSDGPQMIGSANCPVDAFADVWKKLAYELKNEEGILAYSLMNEPHDMPKTMLGESGVRHWEIASQAALDAVRTEDSAIEVHISCYEWGHAPWISKNHARAWITDPSNKIKYEGHHYLYFNRLTATNYPDSYEDEKTFPAGKWISVMNPGDTYEMYADKKYNEL